MNFKIKNIKEKIFHFLIGIFLEIFSIIDNLVAVILFLLAAFIFACAIKVYYMPEIENKSQIIIILIIYCGVLVYTAEKIISRKAN